MIGRADRQQSTGSGLLYAHVGKGTSICEHRSCLCVQVKLRFLCFVTMAVSAVRDELLRWAKDSLSQPEWMEPTFWINHVTHSDLAERHVALLGCLKVVVC